ncbi:carbonic anhydrase-like [Hyperolius riggenbachi]|uniref:carbonic anhydrase-like n=1 Tax=Hyperolius riggenbachi TaxID=752182 RepID=UPI0035A312C7
MLSFSLFIICYFALCCQASEDWCYADVACAPGTWQTHYPTCGLNSQSPIDIITSRTSYNSALGSLQITSLTTPSSAVVTNNGHSVEVALNSEHILSRAGLSDPYRLAAFHFHFGNPNSAAQGSEHLINGQGFPLEAHFVFYNTKYGDLTTAKANSDGLAVVGVLFKIGAKNYALSPLIEALPNVANKEQSVTINFNLGRILPYRSGQYYTYQGSLTTPPCSENVTWHVLADIQQLDLAQYNAITTSLYFTPSGYGHPEQMADNFRPVQPLNGRPVYKY